MLMDHPFLNIRRKYYSIKATLTSRNQKRERESEKENVQGINNRIQTTHMIN